MNDRIIELINAISFFGSPKLAEGNDFGGKIVQYSDDRVVPFGIVSLEERLTDLRERYQHYDIERGSTELRNAFENSFKKIEKQIFAKCKIKPEEINDESIKPYLEKLKEFEI